MDAVRDWTPQQVSAWMRGLDDALLPFASSFELQQVSGERLLSLTHTELLSLGMSRVGHQELLLEALQLLCNLDGAGPALAGHMVQAHQNLNSAVRRRRKNPSYQSRSSNLPPNDFLSAVVELIAAAKELLAALDRVSPSSVLDPSRTKSCIVQLCLELTSTVQKDCTVFEMEEKILEVSKSLNGICEWAAQRAPGLGPLQEVTVSGIKPDQGLGIFIQSTPDGRHLVTGTTENSPADHTQRIHAGDELLQVDAQTVVGWQLKRLVERLRSDSGSVVLTLKKSRAGDVSVAPVRNVRWRPLLVKTQQPCGPCGPSGPGAPEPAGADVLDPAAAPCCSLSGGPVRLPAPPAAPPWPLESVRLRQRSSAPRKVRPVSLPVELCRLRPRRGPLRCTSNERVSAILEEGGFPVQCRAPPPGRGVDHIRGSHCFIGHKFHHSATIYKQLEPGPGPRPKTGPKTGPESRSKAGTVLGGWLSRLRLLSL